MEFGTATENNRILQEIHRLRLRTLELGMSRSSEALRLAIVQAALESGEPTGLSAEELADIPDRRLFELSLRRAKRAGG